MVVLYIYVLHQNEGGIGKSDPQQLRYFSKPNFFPKVKLEGNLEGLESFNPIPRDGSVDQLVLTVLKSIRPF